VLQALPKYIRLSMIAGSLQLTFTTMVVTAVQMLGQADYLKENGIVTGVLRVPEWPFVLLAAFFVIVFALALLVNFALTLRAVAKLRDPRTTIIILLWTLVVVGILYLSFFPETLPFEMSRNLRGVFSICLCFLLIFLGVHVAAAMAVTSLVGISLLIGSTASLTSLGTTTIDVVSNPTWSVIRLARSMSCVISRR